ncbi:hypothetical protein H311_02144 [Anncaliia algerae PRA109]|nr:hypothetical protein H311_02144 [Anncaliia algerae PRA109]
MFITNMIMNFFVTQVTTSQIFQHDEKNKSTDSIESLVYPSERKIKELKNPKPCQKTSEEILKKEHNVGNNLQGIVECGNENKGKLNEDNGINKISKQKYLCNHIKKLGLKRYFCCFCIENTDEEKYTNRYLPPVARLDKGNVSSVYDNNDLQKPHSEEEINSIGDIIVIDHSTGENNPRKSNHANEERDFNGNLDFDIPLQDEGGLYFCNRENKSETQQHYYPMDAIERKKSAKAIAKMNCITFKFKLRVNPSNNNDLCKKSKISGSMETLDIKDIE